MRYRVCPQERLAEAYTGPKLLALPLFRECLETVPDAATICFAGFAEPGLNPDLDEMIAHAARRHRVALYTTGVGISVEAAERMRWLGIDKLVLHLPDTDGNLSLSPSPRLLETLAVLALIPGCEAMSMGAPVEAVAAIVARCLMQTPSLHSRAGNVPGMRAVRKEGPIRCRCSPGLDHWVLLPDGRAALCCMDYGLRHIIGDLSTMSYAEIATGPALATVKESLQVGGDCLCRLCDCAEAA